MENTRACLSHFGNAVFIILLICVGKAYAAGIPTVGVNRWYLTGGADWHLYTSDPTEQLQRPWRLDGLAFSCWNSDESKSIPLNRLERPDGGHSYTKD